MAGTLVADTFKSSTTGAPTFQNTSGTQIGTLCRAFITYNSISQTILASFNVSSVVLNAAGDYTLNFTTALPDQYYCVAMGACESSVAGIQTVRVKSATSEGGPSVKSTTQCEIINASSGTNYNMTEAYIAVFR